MMLRDCVFAGSSTLAVFARMPAKHGNLQVPTPQQDRDRIRGPAAPGFSKRHAHERGRSSRHGSERLELPSKLAYGSLHGSVQVPRIMSMLHSKSQEELE